MKLTKFGVSALEVNDRMIFFSFFPSDRMCFSHLFSSMMQTLANSVEEFSSLLVPCNKFLIKQNKIFISLAPLHVKQHYSNKISTSKTTGDNFATAEWSKQRQRQTRNLLSIPLQIPKQKKKEYLKLQVRRNLWTLATGIRRLQNVFSFIAKANA